MSDAGASTSRPDAILASVLGRIPSGLFVVTMCSGDGRETGLLASWVQQASFEPPMLTVAINVKRFVHEWIAAAPMVGLHLIGEGQREFLKHFGAGFEPDQDAFAGLRVARGHTGVPLLEDVLGILEGRVVSQMSTGDHVIYGVELLAARYGSAYPEGQPWVHIRKSGLRY